MNDVLRKTDAQDVSWKVVNPIDYSRVLLNCDRVVRALMAQYPIGEKDYELLFIERKLDAHDEFGGSVEVMNLELLVLDHADAQIVLHLYDGLVERGDLLRLSGLIDDRNDRTSQFFEAFDRSGAA